MSPHRLQEIYSCPSLWKCDFKHNLSIHIYHLSIYLFVCLFVYLFTYLLVRSIASSFWALARSFVLSLYLSIHSFLQTLTLIFVLY